jgi:hypothetical protein
LSVPYQKQDSAHASVGKLPLCGFEQIRPNERPSASYR